MARPVRRAVRQLVRSAFRQCGVQYVSTETGILSLTYAQTPTSNVLVSGHITVEHRLGKSVATPHIIAKNTETDSELYIDICDPNIVKTLAEFIDKIPIRNRTPSHYKWHDATRYYKLYPHFISDGEASRYSITIKATIRRKLTIVQRIANKCVSSLVAAFGLDYIIPEPPAETPQHCDIYLAHAIRRYCKLNHNDIKAIEELASAIKQREAGPQAVLERYTNMAIEHNK